MTAREHPAIDRKELIEANDLAANYFRQSLLAASAAGPRAYLQSRGLGHLLDDTGWTVGYAPPGWTSMRDQLLQQGLSPEALNAAGLVSSTSRGGSVDRFRDRLTFGIRDLDETLVGFTARCAPASPNSVPKYLNTPRTALYNKSSVMFGLGEQAGRLRDGYNLVLVEGPFDALAVDRVNAGGASRLAVPGQDVGSGGRVLT
jgi:DNA primase